ncbi:MAG: OmpA family protein [Sandaracinaceae bacterium]|jgi:outer membrane protein OmpA-like peptidoglycan-associated protein|nr:OmpA family protein [Sandaracinaceae bacterium]
MRAAFQGFCLSLSLLLALAAPAAVFAQDDFEDEFDEPATPAPAPTAAPAAADAPATTDTAAPASADDEAAAMDGETAAPAEDEETPAEAAPVTDEQALRDEGFRLHNTFGGPSGGIHIVDAAAPPVGTFRTQLALDFFSASSFLNTNDSNKHIGGALTLSWSPLSFLEAYASISAYANSNNTENPQLFQVLGDTVLGAKAFYGVLPWLTVGGDLSLSLLNTVGDIGLVGRSTSMGFRANATADFRHLANPLPLIARLNLQYFLDNSSQLISDTEQARYDALPADRRSFADEERHLLSRVERFALGINRTDRFTIGVGFEAPLRAATDFYINPILEWRLGIPVNRQGYNCLYIPAAGSADPAAGTDGCLDKQGFSSFPQTLTIGVRVLPPVRGLAAFAAVDVGLTGTSTFVRELAPTAPYDVMLGLSWAYDTRPPVVEPVIREVERTVEVRIPPPVKGRVHGIVIEQGAGTPVAGAIVRFTGRDLTAQSTAADGSFTTYELDPGDVQFEISHPEYNPGACAATIAAEGGLVEVRCELNALPRLGIVHGHVVSDTDAAVVGGTVTITGPTPRSTTTDVSGNFNVNDLTPGSYQVRIEAEGFLIKLANFDVRPRETTNAEITVVTRPRRSTVTINRREIVIRRQINFTTNSDTIDPTSFPLLAEIADVIIHNPQLTKIEIQGHTDNVGGAEHNMALSQGRADAVRVWLIQNGVDSSRLESHGYGSTRPLVPNITPGNRARNRRSQFIILEQAAAAPAAE